MITCDSPRLERSLSPDTLRAANSRLRLSGYLVLREVVCEEHGGRPRLRGRVPSYYLKQVAQAVVSEVLGDHVVLNQIEVEAPAARPPVIGPRGGTGPDAQVERGSARVPTHDAALKGVRSHAGSQPQDQ